MVAALAALGALAAPAVAGAQARLSSTPATVTLTVVVPPKVPGGPGAAGADRVRRDGEDIEVTTPVALVDRHPTRVEVSLAADNASATTLGSRVLVRDAAGRFVPLVAGAPVTVLDRRQPPFTPSADVVFRIPDAAAGAAPVPVTYRIVVGEGERAAAWLFVRSLSGAR